MPTTAELDKCIRYLVSTFDATPVLIAGLIVFTLMLGATLVILHEFIKTGHYGLRLLLPLINEYFSMLNKELSNNTPAVRIELLLHGFYFLIFLVCIAPVILHILIPWSVNKHAEYILIAIAIGSLVLFVATLPLSKLLGYLNK